MKRINDYLLITIFILTALLIAIVGLRVYSGFLENKEGAEELAWQEVLERNAQAQSRVLEMEAEIANIQDTESLQRFIDDTVAAALAVHNETVSGDETISDNMTVSGNGTVSGNMTVSGNATVSGNSTVSGNETVSGNATVSGNGTVSGNETVSGNMTVSGNETVSGNNLYWPPEHTLEERRALRTSYEETQEINRIDIERILNNTYDFSDMKIACLGDSITAAANLDNIENYEQYAYPSKLQEILGVKEVYNLGIGGSSIGRYWADAFVDRYTEIPADTDIIIVMGGTNDGFCVSDREFGSPDSREYRTFCGDLDELMKGLRENYPDTEIFFITPLPNILHDYLMSERDYLLPQRQFVEVICRLAGEYDFELIDLYNANILDSHDANVIAGYMPDGVHGNETGYQILAEHIASEIIRHYEGIDDE